MPCPGGCAGIAAVLLTARLNAASPLAGEMYELYAIAAAVIGGTSLMGGEGRVPGTLIGALIMGVLRNGLNLLNVPSSWEGVVVGTVLVAAVIVDRARHRARPAPRGSGWRRHRARWLLAAVFAGLLVAAVAYRTQHAAPRRRLGELDGRLRPQADRQPLLGHHAPGRRGGGAAAGRTPGDPGGRPRDRRRAPAPDHREPDRAAGRRAGGRAGGRQGGGARGQEGQPGRDPGVDRRFRHPPAHRRQRRGRAR